MIAMISSSFFRMSAATPDWLREGGGAEDWLRSGGSTVCVTIMFCERQSLEVAIARRWSSGPRTTPTPNLCAARIDEIACDAKMSAETLAAQLSTPALRARFGTSAQIRRSIDRSDHNLLSEYATAYHRSLSENQLAFLHLSKSGGTALCELAKLNGCWRAGAGDSSLSSNCASKRLADGPRWLPDHAVRAISHHGLQKFALVNFHSPGAGGMALEQSGVPWASPASSVGLARGCAPWPRSNTGRSSTPAGV